MWRAFQPLLVGAVLPELLRDVGMEGCQKRTWMKLRKPTGSPDLVTLTSQKAAMVWTAGQPIVAHSPGCPLTHAAHSSLATWSSSLLVMHGVATSFAVSSDHAIRTLATRSGLFWIESIGRAGSMTLALWNLLNLIAGTCDLWNGSCAHWSGRTGESVHALMAPGIS